MAGFVTAVAQPRASRDRAAERAGSIPVEGSLPGIEPAVNRVLGDRFRLVQPGVQATANGYCRVVGGMLRVGLVLLVYGGVLAVTAYGYGGLPGRLRVLSAVQDRRASGLRRAARRPTYVKQSPWSNGDREATFTRTPRGFIPSQDMGYLLVNIQLPDSASLERTQAVIDEDQRDRHETKGVDATVGIAGQS